ncbi:hypothetical protein KUTeg_008130 [Tegillarca granosa]|uniref:Uncharacterized protein n=1 Tax=Tegillarca granosa TaxID=220873 RepID=A0ABQ9F885_TEGGR|nr:hypothetical protein KUTeg_008130 [Tegillarca granosa]
MFYCGVMANFTVENSFNPGQCGHQPQNSALYQNSYEFNGFRQQPNANVIDGGIRTEQNVFNGFRPHSSVLRNSPTPRNEADHRLFQPEVVVRPVTDVLQQQYGITQSKPKYQQYAVKAHRLSTFRNFPLDITQTPEELAEAGFFFSGKDDVVYCYHCGQGLRAWEPEDDVWVEHARWSPDCVHLLNCKGKEFVRMVKLAESNPEIVCNKE